MYYNGTCIFNETGEVVLKEDCSKKDAMEWFKAHRFVKRTIYNKTYLIYYNGKVTTEDGEVILASGGQPKLIEELEK
jgi:hydroxymethylpyrimidine pyrophosphatase-like HAD family hydrolase